MTDFTPVASTRLAVTNASASVDMTQLAGFQYVEKSGNQAVGVTTSRRPNALRLTYLPTAGASVCYIALGAAAPTATTSNSPIISNWPLQRTLRFVENFIAAITASVGDTGSLLVEVGYGDPV